MCENLKSLCMRRLKAKNEAKVRHFPAVNET